mgnify:CR=1 FL=1
MEVAVDLLPLEAEGRPLRAAEELDAAEEEDDVLYVAPGAGDNIR